MKQQLFLTNDVSVLANYAGTIAGTLNITAVSMAGNQMTCTYTVTSGSAPQAGCRVLLNMAKTANCGIFVILAGGIGTGTFTVTNNSGVAIDTGTAYLVNARYTITTVALVSGTTYRYTYTLLEGSQPFTTDTALIGGCQNTGNNGSFAVTAVNNANKTFDVTNASGVAESGSSGYAALSGAPVGPSIAGGIHQGHLAVGLLPTADLNQMNWSAVIALGVSQTTGSQPKPIPAITSWSVPAAWSSASVSYTGVAAGGQGGAALVTTSGVLWVCISSNTSSGSNGPNMAGGVSNWTPYNFEVWQTVGAMSIAPNSVPIYWRIVYSSAGYAQGTFDPFFKIGTQTTGTGDIAGNLMWINTSGPAEGVLSNYTGATNHGATQMECDFFSDNADTLGMYLWRTSSTNTDCTGVFLDRSRDTGGNMLPAYFGMWTACGHPGNAFTSGINMIAFFPPSGGTIPAGGIFSTTTWSSVYCPGTIANANGAFQGLTPAFPIFPVIGYIGQPFLWGVGIKTGDCSEGQLINVVLYGVSHTYMVTKSTIASNPFSSSVSNANLAFRWE